jgi:ATP-dependent DNA helicase RecQ
MKDHSQSLEQLLNKYFGYSAFRLGQKEIIQDILSGKDVLGVLPTGTGKSICYQLPSLLLEGLTIVVSPLISLMVDQVKQLKAKGFKRVTAINSLINYKQRKSILKNLKEYKLIYCSPEILQSEKLLQELSRTKVSLFVIDEAHCISQWGHEFRTDYLKLLKVIEILQNPPILALTATATPRVQKDIMKYINRPNMKRRIYPMDRENIAFVIEQMNNWEEKIERIIQLLEAQPVPTMIYFSSRKWCEKVYQILKERLTLNIAFYHGGMEGEDRLLIQQQFMNDQLDVICCTSAFGMGIDKQNIRLIIHFHFPAQIESYIQEVGRAGRDGEQSVGLVLFSNGDEQIPLSLIEQELPNDLQIHHVFTFLAKETGKSINEFETALIEKLKLNITQWRFLLFHLEKNNLLRNNILQGSQKEWEQGFHATKDFKMKRLSLKMKQFSSFKDWLYSEDCRRKILFQAFQEDYTKPEKLCCDVCDDIWGAWTPVRKTRQEHLINWREKLKLIFSVGD